MLLFSKVIMNDNDHILKNFHIGSSRFDEHIDFFRINRSNDILKLSNIANIFKIDKFSFFMDLYTISRIYNEHSNKNCCNIFSITNFDKDDFLTEILDCDIFIRSLKIRLLYGDIFHDIRSSWIEQIKLERVEIERPMSSLTQTDRPDSTQPGTPTLERCSSSLMDLDQLNVCDCMICIIYYDIDRQWDLVDKDLKNLINQFNIR